MTVTPWGESSELRARRLRPGPGHPRADVAANQRERLLGAMVAAVAEHGYEATRVADLLAVAGVSRNTFYRHFDNKLDCFLATMDTIVLGGGAAVVGAYLHHDGDWEDRLAAALDTLVESIVAQPAAARLFYVESFHAGPEAIARVEEMSMRMEEMARSALERSPRHAGAPPTLLRMILRAFRGVLRIRLREGREAELPAVAPALLRWALSYEVPPQPLWPRPLPEPDAFPPRRQRAETSRDRILDTVVESMGREGYAALTINDLARQARVSLTTFYEHFAGKEDAVVAAMRRSANDVLDAIAPAYRAAPDWAHAIDAVLDAFLGYLVVRQPFAKFGGVDVRQGSRLIVDVREQMLAGGQGFLAEGFREHPDVDPIVGEAIGQAIDALLFDQVANWGTERLYEQAPLATYVALVPFVGVEQACAIANRSR
ncbi:MAG: TetR/AcrR family transcriptional regulator [Solirubrobacterales bacterium]|nr:TetR/AcrR family transcriptional regulator [Solirubrobacterales bacterium]